MVFVFILLLLLFGWYIYMSFVDWFIHKHIMHNDQSPIMFLRHHHRYHHLYFDKVIDNYDYGITFDNIEAFVIALFSGLPILFLGLLFGLKLPYIICILFLHGIGVFLGAGIHNQFHTTFHGCTQSDIENTFFVPVPPWLYTLLHTHHLGHHENPRTNYCVSLLGFDSLVGTQHIIKQDKKD